MLNIFHFLSFPKLLCFTTVITITPASSPSLSFLATVVALNFCTSPTLATQLLSFARVNSSDSYICCTTLNTYITPTIATLNTYITPTVATLNILPPFKCAKLNSFASPSVATQKLCLPFSCYTKLVVLPL